MVTDKQVRKLWWLLTAGKSLAVAAVRTDMDEKTARKFRRRQKLPSDLVKPHDWQTRIDPFAEVWPEVFTLLQEQPGLQGKTLFGELQRRYPSRFSDGQLRTLQRKVRRWRALSGPPKEVFFAQVHEPGRLAASDFTRMNELGVTIQGQRFEHMVYHFVLTYSNWETATICFSESFESLSEGLQNALRELGGVPARHRTDRMSLAVNNATEGKEFTERYQGLLEHYGLVGEKIQAAHANENGDVEQRHRRFKEAVAQALMLRGSRDFADRGAYARFLHELKAQLNAGRRQRLLEEVAVLRPLPARRLEAYQRLQCRVDPCSVIHVERNSYMVPSRLIGEKVEVRLYAEHLEVRYAQQLVERLPRLRGRDKNQVNYRYIIDWLVRKPGAFAHYRYRQELFPSSVFRIVYDTLVSQDAATADREYLRILHLAAQESETAVEAVLRRSLTEGQPIVAAVVEMLAKHDPAPAIPEVAIDAVDLSLFDSLLTEEEEHYEFGDEQEARAAVARVAPADLSDELRRTGPTGPAGDVQLRALPAGTVRAGMSAAAEQTDRPALAAIPAASGKEHRDLRPETVADEGSPASAEFARRELRGPEGELVGVRESGLGENALAVRIGPGAGAGRPARVVHNVQLAGAGTVAGQARLEAQGSTEATGEVRNLADRRPGLRATKPRGDGSIVHTLGGALRTRQRLVDEQPAVLEVGEHIQGRNDDGGRHRPAGSPQRDLGAEPAQLPFGAGEEEQRGQRDGPMIDSRSDEEPTAWSGGVPLPRRCAPGRSTPPDHAVADRTCTGRIAYELVEFLPKRNGIFNCR
jgi:hypothetical protein